MLTVRAIFGAIGLLLSVSSLSRCELDEKYLALPTSQEIDSQQATFGPIREALEALGDRNHSDDVFTWILQGAIKLGWKLDAKDPKLAVYRMLWQLNDQEDCDQELAEVWLKTYALVRADTKSNLWRKFSSFLLDRGSYKFLQCALSLDHKFTDRLANDESYRQAVARYDGRVLSFMKFVMDGLGPAASDQQLYDVAKKYKLEQHIKSKRLKQFANARSLSVGDYLKQECQILIGHVGNIFNQLNLARALSLFEPRNAKLLKLNEFHRIVCVEPRRPRALEAFARRGSGFKSIVPGE